MKDSLYNYGEECIEEPLDLNEFNDDYTGEYEEKEDDDCDDYDVRDSDFI
jgi:hypothetical protein